MASQLADASRRDCRGGDANFIQVLFSAVRGADATVAFKHDNATVRASAASRVEKVV